MNLLSKVKAPEENETQTCRDYTATRDRQHNDLLRRSSGEASTEAHTGVGGGGLTPGRVSVAYGEA